MAQLNETPTRIQAPPRTADVTVLRDYVAKLADTLALLAKDLDFIINGNLDAKNIRAKSITAERMDVDELSAISANLGHITAGLIEAVTIIGSYIATSQPGVYPRAEMSSTNKMFKVEQSASSYAEFRANYDFGGESFAPTLNFVNGSKNIIIGTVSSGGDLGLLGSDPIAILAFGGVHMMGFFHFDYWERIVNQDTGKNLQQELSSLSDNITTLYNSISNLTSALNNKATKGSSTGSAGGHNHGIPDGTILMKYDGSPVTFHSVSSHSHNQN